MFCLLIGDEIMSKNEHITRNQHYVSRGIQKQFADTKKKVYELFNDIEYF